ncbi:MAG: hypothetical protein JEY99_12820 [Spirochaetales bacterium]|nr:hypothetical protein [Spirochaetales bacterium]
MTDFSCLVKKHGRHHIELKSSLPVPQEGKGRYDLNFYFFSPAQLRFTKETIGTQKVLSNIQTYTRFSSPALPFSALADPDCELSPLNRLGSFLRMVGKAEPIDNKDLVYELQTLVNSFQGEMKSFTELLEQQLSENPEDLTLYERRIRKSLKQTRKILHTLRNFFPRFLDQRIDDNTRTALFWADEALGIISIKNAVKIHYLIEEYSTHTKLIEELQEFVNQEHEYRLERKYQTALAEPQSSKLKERLAYRESILKKWAQSAMYMKCIESRIPRNLGHILAGLAAAAAMTLAVLAAVYAEKVFLKNTTPWALIIILAYVFKDRTKEILREAFGKLLPKMAADKIFKLIDPSTGKIAARSQVIVRFSKENKQSDEIRATRDLGQNPFYSILPSENVFHFHRYISLNTKLLRAAHLRHDSITEITRFRLDDYLKEMDDPEDISYKLIEGKRKRVSGNRVYHLHLVAALKEDSKNAAPRLFHYCLIMNRTGILRVENR